MGEKHSLLYSQYEFHEYNDVYNIEPDLSSYEIDQECFQAFYGGRGHDLYTGTNYSFNPLQ